ncbi:MAG TPA: hypothetical protein VF541_21775, partial [Longimicrobium sp.]
MKTRLLLLLAALAALAAPARAQDTIPRPAAGDTARPDTLRGPSADTVRGRRRAAADSTRARVSADSLRRRNAARRPTSPRPPRRARVAGDTARRGPRVCAGGDVTLGTNLDTTW